MTRTLTLALAVALLTPAACDISEADADTDAVDAAVETFGGDTDAWFPNSYQEPAPDPTAHEPLPWSVEMPPTAQLSVETREVGPTVATLETTVTVTLAPVVEEPDLLEEGETPAEDEADEAEPTVDCTRDPIWEACEPPEFRAAESGYEAGFGYPTTNVVAVNPDARRVAVVDGVVHDGENDEDCYGQLLGRIYDFHGKRVAGRVLARWGCDDEELDAKDMRTYHHWIAGLAKRGFGASTNLVTRDDSEDEDSRWAYQPLTLASGWPGSKVIVTEAFRRGKHVAHVRWVNKGAKRGKTLWTWTLDSECNEEDYGDGLPDSPEDCYAEAVVLDTVDALGDTGYVLIRGYTDGPTCHGTPTEFWKIVRVPSR